ncbi:hypothetical protein HDU76_000353 [Blyttiomyces sp. JEL0837]|nr:hypothetical protein HDU76_000353 [Blyttiomyces sp. JEL0837]
MGNRPSRIHLGPRRQQIQHPNPIIKPNNNANRILPDDICGLVIDGFQHNHEPQQQQLEEPMVANIDLALGKKWQKSIEEEVQDIWMGFEFDDIKNYGNDDGMKDGGCQVEVETEVAGDGDFGWMREGINLKEIDKLIAEIKYRDFSPRSPSPSPSPDTDTEIQTEGPKTLPPPRQSTSTSTSKIRPLSKPKPLPLPPTALTITIPPTTPISPVLSAATSSSSSHYYIPEDIVFDSPLSSYLMYSDALEGDGGDAVEDRVVVPGSVVGGGGGGKDDDLIEVVDENGNGGRVDWNQLITCVICLDEEVPLWKARTITPCNHKLCKNCLHDTIMNGILSRQIPLLCPCCKAERSVKLYVNKANESAGLEVGVGDLKKMVTLRRRSGAVDADPKFRRCPNPTCEGVVYVDNDTNDTTTNNNNAPSTTSHDGMTCRQFQRWVRKKGLQCGSDGKAVDLWFEELVLKEKWKRCPKCTMVTSKNQENDL